MVLFGVFSFHLGCGPAEVKTHPLPKAFPTEHVFHVPEAEVQAAIERMCRDPRKIFPNPANHPPLLVLIWKGERGAKGLPLYKHMVNRDDAYLSCEEEPVCKSTVYTDRRGEPLEYLADFQIHILPQGSNETYVRVTALHPRVIVGRKFAFGSGGFGMGKIYAEVQPTTLEESEVLSALQKHLKADEKGKETTGGAKEAEEDEGVL